MRKRLDVGLRWRSRRVLVLEGPGEVQDAGVQLLGALGLWAGHEGGRRGRTCRVGGRRLGTGDRGVQTR